MFTPQPKGYSSNIRNMGKRKGFAVVESDPPPPLERSGPGFDGGRETEIWRRFREAGFLDEASLEKKEREALLERIVKLEAELYDYQHNMGLLLIEKQEWTLKFEELRQALAEAKEILKREQAAHLIVISEVENREANLRKALEVEKQCVADLERMLHDLCSEESEPSGVHVTSSEKLAGAAQKVDVSNQEISLNVEMKLQAIDGELAEASQKSSPIDWKLHEVVGRASVLPRDRQFSNAEKECRSLAFKQREDRREWENMLQEGQWRLRDSQELLGQRENAIKEKEEALNQKERNLEEKKKSIDVSNSTLKDKEANMSMRLNELVAKEERILKDQENLKVTENKMREHLLLKSELEKEIEQCRCQEELFIKEKEDLKLDRKKVETEWEALDRKMAQIVKEQNQLEEENCKFDKRKEEEEQKLENEKLVMKREVQRKLEAVEFERQSFVFTMEHERSELLAKAKRETDDMLHHVEIQKRELETSTQIQREEMEKLLHGKEKAFEEERNRGMNDIKALRQQAEMGIEEMGLERQRIETEKKEIAAAREHIERDRLELRNAIEDLNILQGRVRDWKKHFIKEKGRLLAFVEQNKACRKCGETIFTNLHTLSKVEDAGDALLGRLSDVYLEETVKDGLPLSEVSCGGSSSNSGGTEAWLHKCSSNISKLLPVRRIDDTIESPDEGSPLFASQMKREMSKRFYETKDKLEAYFTVAERSVERIQSDNGIREMEGGYAPSTDLGNEIYHSLGVAQVISISPGNTEAEPPVRDYSRRKTGKKGRKVQPTNSVKQVIEESKVILGETPEGNNYSKHTNWKHDDLAQINQECNSGSVTTGKQGKKRRQTVAHGVESPGAKRYNLRSSTLKRQ